MAFDKYLVMPGYRLCFLFVFFFTTFSGVARKWWGISPFASRFIFLLQLLTPFLLLLSSTSGKTRSTGKLTPLFLLYIFLLVICASNPLNTSLFHGCCGLVLHSIFWMVLFSYVRKQESFDFFNYRYLLIIICLAELTIAAIQSSYPENLLLNQYADILPEQQQQLALMGTSIRSSGTFSYLSGFSAFNTFSLFLCCYLLKKEENAGVNVVCILASAYNCLLSGSRGGVILFFLTLLLFLALEVPREKITALKTPLLFGLTLILLNIVAADPLGLSTHFQTLTGDLAGRFAKNSNEFTSRLITDSTEPFTNTFAFSTTGIGLGSTYQGANELSGNSMLLTGTPYEGELFRLVIEGGYPLFCARFILLATLLSFFRFSMIFRVYLFFMIGLFLSLVFNVYSSVYTAFGLILLNSAYEAAQK